MWLMKMCKHYKVYGILSIITEYKSALWDFNWKGTEPDLKKKKISVAPWPHSAKSGAHKRLGKKLKDSKASLPETE